MTGESELFERLRSFENHVLKGPVNLFLFVSTECPLHCRFCARRIHEDLARNPENDLMRFLAAVLFRTDPSSSDHLKKEISSGRERLVLGIKSKTKLGGAAEEMDRIIGSAMEMDFSAYKDIPAITSRFDLHDSIRLQAYAMIGIAAKLSGDMAFRMSFDHYIRVVREASELGVRNIYLTGGIGEPLSDRSFLYGIMDEIIKHGITGHITTNAYHADQEFAEHLVKNKWRSIIVSIDGAKEETHDRLRGKKNSFTRATAFLKYLRDAKGNDKSPFPRVSVSFVANRLNYGEIMEHLALVEASGVDSVYYSPMRIYTKDAARELEMTLENAERFQRIITEGRDIWSASGVENNIASFLECSATYAYGPLVEPREEIFRDIVDLAGWSGGVDDNERHTSEDVDANRLDHLKCTEPWGSLVIDANGNAMQCCISSISLVNMNVMRHSLKEIWDSPRYRRLRERFMEGELPVECRYNCPASVRYNQEMMIREYGNPSGMKGNERKLPELIAHPLRHADDLLSKMTQDRKSLKKFLKKHGWGIDRE